MSRLAVTLGRRNQALPVFHDLLAGPAKSSLNHRGMQNEANSKTPTTPVTPKVPTTPGGPAQPPSARIAALTPEVKLEMIHAVRQRLAQETAWLPWKLDNKTAFAAKMRDGKTILVDVKSPEATRFSLIGAFLLEFHLRQLVRTAVGREEFLDHEIPDVVRQVLTEKMSGEERTQMEQAPADENLARLTHAQCLAVLERLETSYAHRLDQAWAERAKRLLENVRLPDLLRKLEKNATIEPAEVATALYHEITELSHRLDRLESRMARDTSTTADGNKSGHAND
jgi:hypothetical protein